MAPQHYYSHYPAVHHPATLQLVPTAPPSPQPSQNHLAFRGQFTLLLMALSSSSASLLRPPSQPHIINNPHCLCRPSVIVLNPLSQHPLHQRRSIAGSSSPPFPHIKSTGSVRPQASAAEITTAESPTSSPAASFRSRDPKDVTVLVTGSTGYIGRFVVRELARRGFRVISVARERSGIRGRNSAEQTLRDLDGSYVCFSDVTNLDSLNSSLDASLSEDGRAVDVAVCCLASRNGGIKDSWRIDYEASKNTLLAARRRGATHFVLLSAICVQKPLLEFQRAKLQFEADLQAEAASDPKFTYSIVRPTAFFKSLAGQVEIVKDGKPYVMFGDGRLCACKPISEEDLASFLADCVTETNKANQVLPIGGPGEALTPLQQGELLFRLLGKEPKFIKVPIGIMDFAIGIFDFLAKLIPSLEDAAEFAKIGRYYAAESMLVLDPETGEYNADMTPSYGNDTLEDFFKRVIRDGMAGQELGEQSIF